MRAAPVLSVFAFALALAACGAEPAGGPMVVAGFSTPESALHDTVADVYLVSNIHGRPAEKDGVGSISRVTPGGGVEHGWIRGGHNGAQLDAPKGMAIVADVLFVADIDQVRRFDRRSGAPLGAIAIPGSVFLNDIAAAPDGTLYVSDSGVDGDLQPLGRDAIHTITADGAVAPLKADPELGIPNGLFATAAGVYVVNWRDGAFFQLDTRGRITPLAKAPAAQLDGLIRPGDGRYLATSWAGRCVFEFQTSGAVITHELQLEQPADLGWDARRRLLLIPLFGKDQLVVRPL